MSSTETTRAVSRIANVIVPVSDQDRQLRFYTETLGLEVRADVPFGNGERWIEVAPTGAETPIALCPQAPAARPAARTRESPCRRPISRCAAGVSRTAAPTSMPRSATWATRCRRSSGSATPRATR